ncbi:MAG: Rieske 2Fe-2S domain-containing protein [Dehalococcoidia bacterium]|nr:Rieske 2Fe-2S domain-containing protein [Dehalococcoidia bacterium]
MAGSYGDSPQRVHQADAAAQEAHGSSGIGPFDYVPKLGFREYWYPALWTKEIPKHRPKLVRMLDEDVVFFRNHDGSAAALTDWCPHRNARLSLGVVEFAGTVTCPYHGYTFDGSGQCVAGLIDHPESPVVPKMRARAYPTQEHGGVVYVWMGETDPVPLEDDLPGELLLPRANRYVRVKEWETNWVEPIAQGVDFHEGYLHRMHFAWRPMFPQEPLWARWLMNLFRTFNKHLGFFRPKLAYYGGVEISHEEDSFFVTKAKAPVFGQGFHPGVNAHWPARVWWRRLKPPRRRPQANAGGNGASLRGGRASMLTGQAFDHSVELPSKSRAVVQAESVHLRWMVPVTTDTTRVWTYTICVQPRTRLGRLWQNVWYYLWRKPSIVVATNEQEDLATFKKDRLRFDLPQKLGPMDAGLIYFRRHLARRSRDFRRLGGAHGTVKAPPLRTADEWRAVSAQGDAADIAPDTRLDAPPAETAAG